MHMLTGSYALDAVTGPETEDFERHLRSCASCADEVRGLRETAARLALAKTVRPPARLQERGLAATYQVRQLPPVLDESHERDQRRAKVTRLFAGRLPAGRWRHPGRPVWVPAAGAAGCGGR